MIFCKIDNELVNIIKKYAKGRHIIDVGCGDGLLGSMLKGITSIDFMHRDTELIPNILHKDAVNYPFNNRCFPVFIRPCHGHFVSRIIDKYQDELVDCLYISNPRNVENDIEIEKYKVQQVEEWIGQNDNERVYLIKLNGGSIMRNREVTFVRVCNNLDKGTSSWWELRDGMLINRVGGRHSYREEYETILETVTAEDFEDLDWNNTYLNNPKENSGWLAPDGTFYGCPSQAHDLCAYLLIKKETKELEDEGYVRIYYKDEWICMKDLTEIQAKFLLEKGYADCHNKLKKFEDKLTLGKDWVNARKYMNRDGD